MDASEETTSLSELAGNGALPKVQKSDELSESSNLINGRESSYKFPKRYVIFIMCYLNFTLCLMLKMDMGVVLIDMQKHFNLSEENGTVNVYREATIEKITGKDEGLIFAIFFIGYIVTHALSGYCSTKYGSKMVLLISGASASFCSLLTPVVVNKFKVIGLILMRFLTGTCIGPSFPSISSLLGHWTVDGEGGKEMAFVVSGVAAGSLLGNFLGGVLASQFHWDSVFYVFGASYTVWTIGWYFFGYSRPENHPTISAGELAFIKKSEHHKLDSANLRIPWEQLLTSKPLWAVTFFMCVNSVSEMGVLFYLATYFATVFDMNTEQAGIFAAVPTMVIVLAEIPIGMLSDKVLASNIWSKTTTRKVFACGGNLIQVVMYCVLANTSKLWLATTLLVVYGLTQCTADISAVFTSHVDLTSNFSGVTMSISNTLAVISVMVMLQASGFILDDFSLENWAKVYYVLAALQFISAAVYAIFGTAEKQKWDEIHLEDLEKDNK